jgi:hypothetical protein
MAAFRKPTLGRIPVFGEIEEDAVIRIFLKDADVAGRGSLDDLERQVAFERKVAARRDRGMRSMTK